jgi:hypothetical protein
MDMLDKELEDFLERAHSGHFNFDDLAKWYVERGKEIGGLKKSLEEAARINEELSEGYEKYRKLALDLATFADIVLNTSVPMMPNHQIKYVKELIREARK